jgi:flagellar biosynthesis/type III secretory pathway protein FliH
VTHLAGRSALLLLDLEAEDPVLWTAQRTPPRPGETGLLVPLFPEPVPLEALAAAKRQADLAAGREEGFRAGLEEGHRVAEQTRQALATETLARLSAGLDATAREASAVMEGAADAVAASVLDALATALPSLTELIGAAEAARFATALLPCLSEHLRVEVFVAPDLVEEVAALLALEQRATVLADLTLAAGDVRLRWRDGIAERRAAAAREAILDAMAALVGAPALAAAPHHQE